MSKSAVVDRREINSKNVDSLITHSKGSIRHHYRVKVHPRVFDTGKLYLVIMLFVATITSMAQGQCPEEFSEVDFIEENTSLPKWPRSSPFTKVYSDPLCLSEDLQVLSRECVGSWHPKTAPKCSRTSWINRKAYCPPGYQVVGVKGDDDNDDDHYVCITLSKTTWSDTCRFFVKDFDEDVLRAVTSHLRSRNIYVTWLPIARLDTFGPLLWQIPGSMWKRNFKIPKGVDILYDGRNRTCFVLDISEGMIIRPEACTAIYPFLCMVGEGYFPRGNCPPKYVASPVPNDDKCFQLMKSSYDVTWENVIELCTAAQMNSPIMTQFFLGLIKMYDFEDDICWIGGDGRHRSNTMAVDSSGVMINLNQNTTLRCIFCEMNAPNYYDTALSLKFYPDRRYLLLNVYDKAGLWAESNSDSGIRCFTNANGDFIRMVRIEKISDKRWTAEDIEPKIRFGDRISLKFDSRRTIYKVELSDKGPGLYVCEGHKKNGELVKTKHVIAYEQLEGHVFALCLDIVDACNDVEHCDPTLSKIYVKLVNDLENTVLDHVIEDIRAMKILNVTIDGNVTILFHITAKEWDDELFHEVHLANAYLRIKKVFQLLETIYPKIYRFNFLRSCAGCLPSKTIRGDHWLDWPFTFVGTKAVSRGMCLNSAGLPVYRSCMGNYMHGGTWAEPLGECTANVSSTTLKLYKISSTINSLDRKTIDTILDTVENAEELTAADIYYLSLIIMEYRAQCNNHTEMLLEDIYQIVYLLDKVIKVDQNVLKKSQVLNSTNVLLDSLGAMLDYAAVNISSEALSNRKGLIVVETSRLIVQIADPSITNITGLALLRNSTKSSNSNGFTNHIVISLTADQTIEDVTSLGDVEVAAWLPRSLLNSNTSLHVVPNDTRWTSSWSNVSRVIVMLFYNDLVFNSDYNDIERSFIDSRVVSISVPEHERNLPFPIPILFKSLTETKMESEACAFWDFEFFGVSPMASYSAWSREGCDNAGNTRDDYGQLNICLCSHLTHFAQLVLGHIPETDETGHVLSDVHHDEALEIITVVGCVLSIVGIFGIFITAFVFKSWRKKPGSKVLIQLSLALCLEKFVIGATPFVNPSDHPIPCIIVGILLHYAVLAQFCWMLITAWLQFKRYVIVLGVTRPPRFLLKAAIFAWGFPFFIVTTVVAVDPNAYLPPAAYVKIRFCQVFGLAQYLGLLLPVTIVMVLNVILFVRVIYSLLHSTRSASCRIEDDTSLVVAQLRLGIVLFFLLGISWLFGLAAKMGAGLIFSYLFCVTAALQGFVLFLFFVVCDPATRKLWYSVTRLTMSGRLANRATSSFSTSNNESNNGH